MTTRMKRMEIQRLPVAPSASALRASGGALFWLAHDEEGARVSASVGFGRQERALFMLAQGSTEPRLVASSLPPYESLALDERHAYVWGPELRAVIRIDADGQKTTIEAGDPGDGGLWWDRGQLLLRGEARSGEKGVFVLDQGSWSLIYGGGGQLEWPDLQRVVVGNGAVFAVEYVGGKTVLCRRDLQSVAEGEELADLSSLTVRRLAATASGVLLMADEGVFEYKPGGSLRCLVDAAENAPVDAVRAGAALVWLEAAVVDHEGEMISPARVYTAVDPNVAEVACESAGSISGLIGCSWGAAWIESSEDGLLSQKLGDVPISNNLAMLHVQ